MIEQISAKFTERGRNSPNDMIENDQFLANLQHNAYGCEGGWELSGAICPKCTWFGLSTALRYVCKQRWDFLVNETGIQVPSIDAVPNERAPMV